MYHFGRLPPRKQFLLSFRYVICALFFGNFMALFIYYCLQSPQSPTPAQRTVSVTMSIREKSISKERVAVSCARLLSASASDIRAGNISAVRLPDQFQPSFRAARIVDDPSRFLFLKFPKNLSTGEVVNIISSIIERGVPCGNDR